MRLEIKAVGVGGQGIQFLGRVLAHAAVIEGLHATFTGSYGAEVRGTPSWADVVVSDEPVTFPFCESPRVLVCMFPPLLEKMELRAERIYVSSKSPMPGAVAVDAEEAAVRAAGRRVLANMVMAAFVSAREHIASLSSLKAAVREEELPFLELNLRALEEGWRLAEVV